MRRFAYPAQGLSDGCAHARSAAQAGTHDKHTAGARTGPKHALCFQHRHQLRLAAWQRVEQQPSAKGNGSNSNSNSSSRRRRKKPGKAYTRKHRRPSERAHRPSLCTTAQAAEANKACGVQARDRARALSRLQLRPRLPHRHRLTQGLQQHTRSAIPQQAAHGLHPAQTPTRCHARSNRAGISARPC